MKQAIEYTISALIVGILIIALTIWANILGIINLDAYDIFFNVGMCFTFSSAIIIAVVYIFKKVDIL